MSADEPLLPRDLVICYPDGTGTLLARDGSERPATAAEIGPRSTKQPARHGAPSPSEGL